MHRRPVVLDFLVRASDGEDVPEFESLGLQPGFFEPFWAELLHTDIFATISHDGTVQDVIDLLVINPEVTSEILGDLQPYGWALQRIRREHHGRQWEEDELEALGNGQ